MPADRACKGSTRARLDISTIDWEPIHRRGGNRVVDVRYALEVLWPRAGILIASGIIAAVAALAGTSFLPPEFESHATLLVGQSSGAPPVVYEDLLAAQILAETYASLSTTTPVLAAARERSGLSISVDELRDLVRVEALRNRPLIVITSTFRTGDEAARAANAVAQETAAIGASDSESLQVSVVDPAEPAAQPVSPRPLVNAAIAGGIGVVASAGFILGASTMFRWPARRRATSGVGEPVARVGEPG